jgi:hypothetical protein
VRKAGHVAHMGPMNSTYNALTIEPKGKTPLGTHRHRWEDNIKMDLNVLRGCELD